MTEDIKELKILAQSGDMEAQYELGHEYYLNLVKDGKDHEEQAFYWFEKAADQGHTKAEHMLAHCLQCGVGVRFSNASASFEYYLRSAKKGHVSSMVELYKLYSFELTCHDWDFDEAFYWIKQAAECGNAEAEYILGKTLVEGFPMDFKKKFKGLNAEEGIKWLEKAAKKNYLFAAEKLGDIYFNGIGVEKNLKTALEWYEKGGNDRNGDSFWKIGEAYFSDGNYEKAFEYFTKGAKLLSASAKIRLGDCYYRGLGTERNLDKALENYKQAALSDTIDCDGAKSNLALMYATDTPFKDEREAVIWLHQAYNYTKNPEVFYEVAKRHLVGVDFRDEEHPYECYVFRKSDGSAALYFKKAADKGHIPSCLEYAKCLLNGFGVEADREGAINYFKKAADGGSEQAKKILEEIQG